MNELNEAEFKANMRKLYKDIGYPASLTVLYEMIKGADIFLEIILEEEEKEFGTTKR